MLAKILASEASFACVTNVVDIDSPAFLDGGDIPAKYTVDGGKLSPPLRWSGVPNGTATLVVVVEDADSPSLHPLVHAIAINLDGTDGGVCEGGLTNFHVSMGQNSFRQTEFLPIAASEGRGMHHYAFQIFALNAPLDFPHAPNRDELVAAMNGNVLGMGFCVGCYASQSKSIQTDQVRRVA
jgi:Raf kinase inhibitor-like YbhB/YbcL family protein